MFDSEILFYWISKERYNFDDELKVHSHNYFHYIFVIEGSGLAYVDGSKFEIKEGQLYLTPPNLEHGISFEKTDGFIRVVEFKFNIVNDEFYARIKKLDRILDITNKNYIDSMLSEVINQKADYAEMVKLRLLYLLFNLLRYPQKPELTHYEKSDRINFAIEYMKQNIKDNPNLDTISKNCGMSKYYFSRKFKKQTGFAPMEYFIKLKIEFAKELMIYSDLNISKTANEAGFSNVYYFSNVFKRQEGMTPSEYIKKYNPNLYYYLKDRKEWLDN